VDISKWDQSINIDVDSPMYQQLETIILNRIKSNELESGEMLPSESELCGYFKISRSTVRQALTHLEKNGYLVRRRGLGTFIAEPKVHRKLDYLYSFTSQMSDLGLKSYSRILSFKYKPAEIDIAEKLKIVEGTSIYSFSRLRIANEIPMLIETTIIPGKFCPGMTAKMLETGSLYAILQEQYNVDMSEAVETYEPILINKRQSELLKCKDKSCAFSIERISYTSKGEVFELTQSIMSGQYSRLEITLRKDGISVNRK